ncbi:MAG: hypothetical protein GY694_18900 [Gammaproteobacteria bacterium]|nr:hypothetical protein [Gammaproteobacteria bacterium]
MVLNLLQLNKKKIQTGQAMVEFIITASFILIPLFLMVPLLAKYIDIQHSTIQAARYEVWEYTAWFSQSSDVSTSFNVASVIEATKSTTEVQNESRQRFFSNTNLELSDGDKYGWESEDENPFWNDYQMTSMFEDTVDGSLQYSEDTPDLTSALFGFGIVNTLIDVVEGIPAFLISVLSAGTLEPGFTALNSGGYNKSTVQVSVINAPDYTDMNGSSEPLFGQDLDLAFRAQAAVLSDGWNAGGGEHAKTEEEGLVPTILLRKPFDFVVDILDYIPFIPSSELGSLEWGHTDAEAIPPEYMEDYDADSNATECGDDSGYCSYPTF